MTNGAVRPAQQIETLAERVLAGQVAFFVGAGFSLDSEQNGTGRLQARLLARFSALSQVLGAGALRDKLLSTFDLRDLVEDAGGALLSREIVRKLTPEYYSLNDWMCAAFAWLVQRVNRYDEPTRKALLTEVEYFEDLFLKGYGERVPFDPIDLSTLGCIRDDAARGKALFLETLGFASMEIMAGLPEHPDLLTVRSSYQLRPRQRHEVLARLAREGLCPTLVTTNYDLLIEGAYRLAGFEYRSSPVKPIAPTQVPHMAVVGEPLEFFELGDGSRTALVLKLHGCASLYRQRKEETLRATAGQATGAWERYLRAIVYTYREIQNWREDSWSRDFLCTLLRTRTLVLCGYSVADSVVHDTFRTVYEELWRHRAAARPPAEATNGFAAPTRSARALPVPAFFFGPRKRWEFHGAEILRAASRASGESFPGLTHHPHYVQFEYVSDGAFPTMDQLFVWLYHRVLRLRQKEALEQELPRVASQLLLRPPRDEELARLRARFAELLRDEERVLSGLRSGSSTSEFSAIVAWTDQFHVAFLRQLALADAVARRQRPRRHIDELKGVPTWYFPFSERPDWGAWGVVIELALRRMIASSLPDGTDWKNLRGQVLVHAEGGVPSLTWRAGHLSHALAIRFRVDAQSHRYAFVGAPRSRRLWEPAAEQLPWPRETPEKAEGDVLRRTPDARALWSFAAGLTESGAHDWLEEPNVHEHRQHA